MDNISQHCIICFNKKHLIKLNKTSRDETRFEDYTDLLYRCFRIQFLSGHRGKTHNICGKCIARLKYCCAFRKNVERAHQKLYKTIEKNLNGREYEHTRTDPFVSTNKFLNRRSSIVVEDDREVKDDNDREDDIEVDGEVNDDNYREVNDDNDREVNDDNDREDDTEDNDSDSSTKTNEIFTSTGYYQELEQLNIKEKPSIPPLGLDCKSCPICNKLFDNRYRLKLHYDNHFPTHLCDLCGQSFAKRETFIIHMKHHQGESYPCEHCQRTYKTKHSMNQHVRLAHLNEKLYTCLKCPKRFRVWLTRRKHMLKEHGVQCAMYKCPKCDESFIVKQLMLAHLRRFHFKEKDYRCEICSFASFTKFELKTHMLKHTGIKNHNCEYCGRAFSRRDGLKEHLKIHLNIKNFQCEHCDKAFVQKCALKGHLKIHQKM